MTNLQFDRSFDVLATDYDGTIAHHGIVDDATLASLRRVRDAGVKLVLVSGRERESLARTFQHFEIFDLMVLENGATLYEPSTQAELALCDPPRADFVEALRAANVHPLSVGNVIVATFEPHQVVVLETIRDARSRVSGHLQQGRRDGAAVRRQQGERIEAGARPSGDRAANALSRWATPRTTMRCSSWRASAPRWRMRCSR